MMRLPVTARHDGKTYTLSSPVGIPADCWARVRVTLDGAKAAIHVDGKQVAQEAFAFSPRSVFSGDRTEGNFIACGRHNEDFFAGRMDHFRIYRDVHEDFDALGPVPPAITQLQEWSELDQQKADAWEAKKNIVMAGLSAGKYGQLQEEMEKCKKEQYQIRRKQHNLDELETRARAADESIGKMPREINEAFRAEADVAKIEEDVRKLKENANAIANDIKKHADYVKLDEQFKARQKQMHEVDALNDATQKTKSWQS